MATSEDIELAVEVVFICPATCLGAWVPPHLGLTCLHHCDRERWLP